jgi:hypothetical protein
VQHTIAQHAEEALDGHGGARALWWTPLRVRW